MKKSLSGAAPRASRHAIAMAALLAAVPALAQEFASTEPDALRRLGIVVVNGSAPTSLPTTIPTTIEGLNAAEIAKTINATDAEDALKYLPSLLVRKRYIGDYNHAVLSTRASGTGNSARSLVYADGIPLSNLLGNGATFTPRWALVTPEEIERVDVLYGPFSPAYAGNSVGAVVDYQTRMPKAFEAHAKLSVFSQPFSLYNSKKTYGGSQASASLGDRYGNFTWWLNLNHLDSDGQPLTFITKPVSSSAAGSADTVVSGNVLGADKSNVPWQMLGAGTQYHSKQDHAKLKLALDLTPQLRLSYLASLWQNRSEGQSESWLRDASGKTVYGPGAIAIGGKKYTLAATDFNQNRDRLEHLMQGLTLKSNTRGAFDFELAASQYDYRQDDSRAPNAPKSLAKPAADDGGPGRLSDLAGTGWRTLAAKGVWRPAGSAHVIEGGLQQESYRWQQRQTDLNGNWLSDSAEAAGNKLFLAFVGKTQLRSAWAQDAWQVDGKLKAVLGLRAEEWHAFEGAKTTADLKTLGYQDRVERYLSPKAALGYELSSDWSLKLATGRAVRMPTVGELFQGGSNSSGNYTPNDPVTNPNLKPEQGWTSEASAIWSQGDQQLRSTLFHEDTRDALYSQQTEWAPGKFVSSTQNIGRIRTIGLELAYQSSDVLLKGLDLQGSLTYADSKILANDGFVSTPGDTIGKQQPRVPKWRASAMLSYALSPSLSASYGLRYSGNQWGTLNNSDPNGFAYQGFSKFFSTDLRVVWKAAKQWTVAAGIDNLNNYQFWNFHPYPQRSFNAELRFDL
ncbi:TonB-dependent receptor [Paucibacter sp. APW11]|uniref:TonB-dependent receptor n=1 Tax=Roseateles aquae TaxID=3077235 RepID=A0ABU3PFM7_9BURK|nr:TonB-dependent receptor [Paucibacter sp. APW11]MDT9001401.1 TonB-dependent receptor [Paucibacter sp. APW11]